MYFIRLLFNGLSLIALLASNAMASSYDDLLKAIKLNDIPAAEALFAKGMDVDTTDPEANSLLMIAVRDDRAEMAERIVRRKARVNAQNKYGETALMLASANGSLKLVRLLVEHEAKINLPGWNPLIYAAWRGHTEVVRYLLGKGAEIDSPALNGITALMMAARGGHFETVKLLLWEVANPNLRSDSGATALQWALNAGNTDIAALLKQAGAVE